MLVRREVMIQADLIKMIALASQMHSFAGCAHFFTINEEKQFTNHGQRDFFLSSNSTEHGAINNFELLDLRLVLARRAAHLIDTKKSSSCGHL